MDYDKEFFEWTDQHADDDITRLRLGKHKYPFPWIDEAISHIENKRRSRSKFNLPGYERLIPALMPLSISVEQSSSARVALLHNEIASLPHGARVLDMTCGLGVDASFLAADDSVKLTALDLNNQVADVASFNFANRPGIGIIHGDSIEYLKDSKEHFDLIFIDPARRDSNGGKVFNLHDCTPDVTSLLPLMTSKADAIMIKMSPMLDVTQTLRDLPSTHTLYIVGERGECRELLALIKCHEDVSEPIVTVWNDGLTFSFTPHDEALAAPSIALPATGDLLLEPSPVMMKAGPYKLICQAFKASMIHPNTHLYITRDIPVDFPGKVYTITDVIPYSSSNIKRISKMKLEADVAVRNFPISAETLRQRLGIKKSGTIRIVGVTAHDGNQYLLLLKHLKPKT